MHFLVLGATGAIGTIFLDIALEDGHKITALVRDINKLDDRSKNHDRVHVIQGSLADDIAIKEALSTNPDAFVSFAGPVMGRGQGTPLTDGYANLLPNLTDHGIKRILILGTPSIPNCADVSSYFWGFSRWFMTTLFSYPYNEMVGIGKLLTSQPTGLYDWTLFRVGGLTDGDVAEVKATHLGSGQDRISITRSSVARWVLTEATEGKWIEKSPYICN